MKKQFSIFSVQFAKSERGFTLLLAALVSSIVLSIGAAIFSIALKQVTLSSIGKNSQFAFYAADTAAECALYWDIRAQAFAASDAMLGKLSLITCDGQTISTTGTDSLGINVMYIDTNPSDATTRFKYETGKSGGLGARCTEVSVAKTVTASGVQTVIHADGYSTACDTIATDPQALQRSVELHY